MEIEPNVTPSMGHQCIHKVLKPSSFDSHCQLTFQCTDSILVSVHSLEVNPLCLTSLSCALVYVPSLHYLCIISQFFLGIYYAKILTCFLIFSVLNSFTCPLANLAFTTFPAIWYIQSTAVLVLIQPIYWLLLCSLILVLVEHWFDFEISILVFKSLYKHDSPSSPGQLHQTNHFFASQFDSHSFSYLGLP